MTAAEMETIGSWGSVGATVLVIVLILAASAVIWAVVQTLLDAHFRGKHSRQATASRKRQVKR